MSKIQVSNRIHAFVCSSLSVFIIFFSSACALPMCTDLRAPYSPNSNLTFCSNNANSTKGCCTSNDDRNLQNKFKSMHINDSTCAAFINQILCAKCDQFSADLFQVSYRMQRSVPMLCNSMVDATNSSAHTIQDEGYCSRLWIACQNVSIQNSPFVSVLENGTANSRHVKINELWESKEKFCVAFGGSSNDMDPCFNGTAAMFNTNQSVTPIEGICLERIAEAAFVSMVPHPDGSNRVFLASKQGKVWLATIPDYDSGKVLEMNLSSPFIDLSNEVASDGEYGLLGLAFHPNFDKNGRFFASFNCYKTKSSNCEGRCACNPDVGCDPSQLNALFRTMPCQYFSIISEFSVNNPSPAKAMFAEPTEVRRIFTMGLPFAGHHGGQILFGPQDGYLYFMMGDGGDEGDPYNFAQNSRSLLGKIMRFDIDIIPSEAVIQEFNLWGNYSIPADNPYTGNTAWQPEIWALGLRNPWRCSFDTLRPDYFFCGDVGQDTFEEVDLITKGGNYGWRVYEGYNLYSPPVSVGGNTTASSIQAIFPVMGYYHKDLKNQGNSASIIGGYVSRSEQDPCLYGGYLYGDLYGNYFFVGIENPVESGSFSNKRVSFRCSPESPIPCSYSNQSAAPDLQYIFSFGEDNNKDIYLLTYSGVYRVVQPSKCNFRCSKEKQVSSMNDSHTPQPSPGPHESQPPSGSSSVICSQQIWLIVLFSIFLLF